MAPDTRQLRVSGKQWQMRRKLPKALAKKLGRTYHIQNLGRISLPAAQLKRDRINVELAEAEARLVHSEAVILADYMNASDHDRVGIGSYLSDMADDKWQVADKSGDEEGKRDAIDWYKRVTGEYVPIAMNLELWQKQKPVGQVTRQNREAYLAKFVKWSPVEHVHEVDRRLAGRYVDHLVDEGLAPKTVHNRVTSLGSYWNFMVRKGIAENNPWQNQSLSNKAKQERDAWSLPQARRLLRNAPNNTLAHAIAIGALHGFRAAEITLLKVSDCVDGLCRIREGKTENAPRTVPWHSQLEAVIEARLAGKGPDDWLLEELRGNDKSLSKRFTKYRNKLMPELRVEGGQSKLVFHSFRHTFIAERVKAGCPQHIIEEAAGHKSKGVTLGVYGKGAGITLLREVIEAVQL